MSPLIRPLRSLANGVGLAWWARVETTGPDVTYWFGPFLSRRGLEHELATFLEDVGSEQPQSAVQAAPWHQAAHTCHRCVFQPYEPA